MANIRIDNFSDDTVTVILDGKEQIVEDEGRVAFDSLEKGRHSLRIHRTRIPLETADYNEQQEKSPTEFFGGKDKSLHVPLDYLAEIDLNSSKAVITVKSDVSAKEGKGLDAIFASYALVVAGAKEDDGRKAFANQAVKKRFVSHHLKSLMFPVGICALVLLGISIAALLSAISGNPINLGGTVFTLPWAAGLSAVAVAVCVYSIVCLLNVIKVLKKLTNKKERTI